MTDRDISGEVWDDEEENVYRGRRRRKRHIFRNIVIFAAVLAAAAFIICAVAFKTDYPVIEGNSRVSDEEVLELIHWDDSRGSILLLWLMNRSVDVSDNALVNRIEVSISDPENVTVQVREESLAGCVPVDGTYCYLNRDGLIVITDRSRFSGVPLLSGIELTEAEAGSYAVTEDDSLLPGMLDIAAWSESYGIEADSIGEADDGGYVLYMGNIKVQLGRDINMEDKISELCDLLGDLEGLTGTLHMEDYDSSKDTIIFTKE